MSEEERDYIRGRLWSDGLYALAFWAGYTAFVVFLIAGFRWMTMAG